MGKLTNPSILPQIPQLIHSLYDSVQKKLITSDIHQLVCLAPSLSADTLTLLNLLKELLEEDSLFVKRYNKSLFVWEVGEKILTRKIMDFQNEI